MRGKKLYKKEEKLYKQLFIDAFDLNDGVVVATIRHLEKYHPNINIVWNNFHIKWQKWDPEYAMRINEIRGRMGKLIEDVMFDRIVNMKDSSLIKFYLERKGGYKEETKQELNINQPIKINIINPDEDKEK